MDIVISKNQILIKMTNKTTKMIDTDYQELTVVGVKRIQIQIEQDGDDAFIDLSQNEARELARVIIEHCDSILPSPDYDLI